MPNGFLIVLGLYGGSIAIAISPIGEGLLRYLQGVRRISTKEEQEYILPLFNEVYKRAKEVTPELSGNIEIFITDEMHVNAYAFGRNTIVVTRGLLNSMDEEQVMGVMAHELGHLYHGHALMILLNVIGNGIFSIAILIFRFFMFFVRLLMSGDGFGNFMGSIMNLFTEWTIMALMWFSTIAVSANSRKNEYQADKYALSIGFGEGLLSGLYLLQNMSMGRISNVIERLTASHPYLAYRIERLENGSTKKLPN
jgi:heat shock protein HtpX